MWLVDMFHLVRRNYAQISENIWAVDWIAEFEGRSLNGYFLLVLSRQRWIDMS